MINMKLHNKLSALFLVGLMLAGNAIMTGCSNDELDTNPYNKSGVNLLGFGPCPLTRLSEMRITGTKLDKVDKVLFPQGNSKVTESVTFEEAPFNLVNDEEITVTVPDQTIPGRLRLVVGNDTIVSKSLITFSEEIDVTNVSPVTDLRAGDVITITGEYVWNIATVTFADNVVVGAEEFLTNTRKEIKVAVPKEAQSGDIVFSNGAESPEEFTWNKPLVIRQANITSISNVKPEFGETIKLTGTDLDLVETVQFPMLADSTSFTVNTAGTELIVNVPTNTISGVITLTQYSGIAIESAEYALPLAEYASITPTEELKTGDKVTITGSNLNRIASLKLPGDITLEKGKFTQSNTEITFNVPENMGDGMVTLVQHENYSVQTAKIAMHHEGPEQAIWQGNVVVGEWSGSLAELSWGAYDWSQVKPGQILTAYATMNSGAGYAKLRFGNGSWAALPSSGGDLDLLATDTKLSVTLTQSDIDELTNNGGLVICGANFTITKVTLSVLEQVIWSGSWTCSGWSGNQDLAYGAYDWSTFEVGQKLLLTVEFADPSGVWGCISPRMGQDWGGLSVSQIDLTSSAEAQTIEFAPIAADIEHLKNDGGLVLTGDGYILKKVSIQ